MGINRTYNIKSIEAGFEKDKKNLISQAISLFFQVGKTAVDLAFANGNYINRTGVLRSSIGCGVSFEGIIKETYGFRTVIQGDKGATQGKTYLEELLKENPKKGQVKLVVVAGAEHASFVEDNAHYIVIDNAADFVENNVGFVLRQLNVITS